MSELEIRENLINLRARLNEIISNGESEKRELNADETNEIAELKTKIDDAESQLETIENENRELKNKNNNTKNEVSPNDRT